MQNTDFKAALNTVFCLQDIHVLQTEHECLANKKAVG